MTGAQFPWPLSFAPSQLRLPIIATLFFLSFLLFHHSLYMDKVTMVYKFYSTALEVFYVLSGSWVKGSASAWGCCSLSICIGGRAAVAVVGWTRCRCISEYKATRTARTGFQAC